MRAEIKWTIILFMSVLSLGVIGYVEQGWFTALFYPAIPLAIGYGIAKLGIFP